MRAVRLPIILFVVCAVAFGAANASLKSGKAELKSAGPLAFGPEGILFVGDSAGASIVALDTEDRKPAASGGSFEITELALENIKHSSVSLPDAPGAAAKDGRGQSLRQEAITHIAFVNGNVIVAGLSNEELSSSLRSIPFPFQQADKGASIEIFHGS